MDNSFSYYYLNSMQNVICEFEMPSGVTHVCIINRDALRDNSPKERIMACAMDTAMASPEKYCMVPASVYDAVFLKNYSFPCEVEDHIVLKVFNG